MNGTSKASKHRQESSCDKLVTFLVFQQNDINPLEDEFKHNFLVKKAEIVSLKLEHQNEIQFLKRRISVDNFGWHVELGQRYLESLLDAIAMNHCKSMATPGSKGQESSRNVADLTEKLDPQEHRESLNDRATLRHYFQYEGNHERGSRTDHGLKDKIEENRALPQSTSAMCKEFSFGGKAGRRHPCDRGCRLGWRPKDKVLHVWWSVGNRSVLHSSTLICDTGNSMPSSAESEAKAITKGCIEALCVKHLLEHQTARPLKIEVLTDSSSAKAIMLRLGPGHRAKHLEVQTMWAQKLNKIGLISLNKLNTLENVADCRRNTFQEQYPTSWQE